MNKNWNDRADKDLFFAILSVKSLDGISGAEWAVIGNSMRALGYGFTNEGCRQHFQGLRRAQKKAETAAAAAAGSAAAAAAVAVRPVTPRFSDPALNPVTRRPGPPGRVRTPRKRGQRSSSAAEAGAEAEAEVAAATVTTVEAAAESLASYAASAAAEAAAAAAALSSATGLPPILPHPGPDLSYGLYEEHQHQQQHHQHHNHHHHHHHQNYHQSYHPNYHPHQNYRPHHSAGSSLGSLADAAGDVDDEVLRLAAVAPMGLGRPAPDADHDGGPEAKRPKLVATPPPADSTREDEAVRTALAAHNGAA